ncbi:TraR/DksA family transcriptional regulator [Roseivirga sp. 4D4]|uniref:TraR/DksA family transcriptional regulator n=1 Tax=Roseivirga sp. 4D4 TaxID=1889784 RepID=UPI0008539D75|nr:TraR/DksA C4-type zinc finger protein [Roseivirga sp. 4D4]OEK00247.1 TraR/DksA family transcriptional regulator [Roseivirga sp. 4D4]
MGSAELKHQIEEEIKRTEALVTEYKEMSQPVSPDDAIGRISRMDAINNKSVTEAALRQAENKLASLKSVISNIDSPDFGICVSCKQPIPIGRILIRPESQRCVNCAR